MAYIVLGSQEQGLYWNSFLCSEVLLYSVSHLYGGRIYGGTRLYGGLGFKTDFVPSLYD